MNNEVSYNLVTILKKDKMKQILKDTRDHYAEDPDNRRSIDKDGNCKYTWGKQHGAVGRYLKPEYQVENWENNNESVNELCEDSPEGWDIDWVLRDEVHGLDADFWRDLQDFHDSKSNWICEDTWFPERYSSDPKTKSSVGLSDAGKGHYVGMQDRIAEGKYDG